MRSYHSTIILLILVILLGYLFYLSPKSVHAQAQCSGSGTQTYCPGRCVSDPDTGKWIYCDDACLLGKTSSCSITDNVCKRILSTSYTCIITDNQSTCSTPDYYSYTTGSCIGGPTITPTPRPGPTATPTPVNKYTISINCLGKGTGKVKQKSDGKVLCTCTGDGNKTGSCEKEDLSKGSNSTFTKDVDPGSSFNSWSHGTCPSGTDCSPCEDGGNCNINNITGDLTIKAKFDLACAALSTPAITAPTAGNYNPGIQTISWTDPSNPKADSYDLYINSSLYKNYRGQTSDTYNFTPGTYSIYVISKRDCGSVSSASPTITITVADPQAILSGKLREYAGVNSCADNISSTNTPSMNTSYSGSANAATSCSISPVNCGGGTACSSYLCTVTFTGLTPTQHVTGSLSLVPGNYGPYTNAYGILANQCTNTASSINLDISPGTTSTYSNANGQGLDALYQISKDWIKLKNLSFSGFQNLTNVIPLFVKPFDSDDPGDRVFVSNDSNNDPGAVTAGIINLGTAPSSSFNWQGSNSIVSQSLDVPTYIDYIKSRKTYQQVSCSDAGCSNLKKALVNNSVFLIQPYQNNPVSIDNGTTGGLKNVVLISSGSISINDGDSSAKFNANGDSIAVLAHDTLTISSNVTEINGIFIATTIDTSSSNKGLKINGNLIGKTLNNQRALDDKFKPSIFIVFKPYYYFDLLPYLSTATYDWKQLQ